MKPEFAKIPQSPGVYQYFDVGGKLIYIGKAKNLRNRIRSYWSSRELPFDKQQMVASINRVEWIVVHTETEAILLEAGLIKKHQPKFNIVLRDDKSWSYIIITHEPFPKILKVRGTKRKGDYFGPYTRAGDAKTLVRLIHKILPLRTCERDLSKLPNGRVCMQYHLGNCLGPCEKLIGDAVYNELIRKARMILKGETTELETEYESRMKKASRKEHFEEAAVYRNKLRALSALRSRQDVVSPHYRDKDVIGIVTAEKKAAIAVMQIRGGQMLDTISYMLDNELNLEAAEILEQALLQHYAPTRTRPRELILAENLSRPTLQALAPIRMKYPKRGAQKRLLDLAQKNAWNVFHRATKSAPLPDVLYRIREALALPDIPVRIEVYDISNFQGAFPVGAMVVSERGALKPSQYRSFVIKTVEGSNDVGMMREVLTRRLSHNEWPSADLIVLDGGKPQLNAVYPILSARLRERVVALAKREEEIFVPGKKAPIQLSKKDPALLYLMRIRDEVHRRAISHYRKRHRKASVRVIN